MLEDKDIQKMKEVFPSKEDLRQEFSDYTIKEMEIFATKEDLEKLVTKKEFRNAVAGLHTAIDTYAQKADTYFQEMVALSHKVDRHERWFYQVAEKLGIKLEY